MHMFHSGEDLRGVVARTLYIERAVAFDELENLAVLCQLKHEVYACTFQLLSTCHTE